VLAVDHLTWRELRPSDAPALLVLETAAEAAEPAEESTDLTEIQEHLADPGLRLSDGSVAVLDGTRLVASGSLGINGPTDSWAAHLQIIVLPEFRRRGIGRELLERLLGMARSIHSAEHPELPGEVRVWLPQGRDSAAAFAQQAGFTPRRYFVEMRVELSTAALPEPGGLAGLEIRPWTKADDEDVRLAYNASFADHWGSAPSSPERWRNMFADSSAFRPEFSRLAAQDGQVVGFVMSDEFDSETRSRGYRTGYIDRVGTLRSVRGRGVATTLMVHCLLAMRESGCRYADLTVDSESPTGAGRLYERLGFAVHRRNEVRGLEIATLG
jgi:mycothiol synthase